MDKDLELHVACQKLQKTYNKTNRASNRDSSRDSSRDSNITITIQGIG